MLKAEYVLYGVRYMNKIDFISLFYEFFSCVAFFINLNYFSLLFEVIKVQNFRERLLFLGQDIKVDECNS